MIKKLVGFMLVFLLCVTGSVCAQTVIDEFEDSSTDTLDISSLLTEKVNKVSASGRIFILTNNSGVLIKGDFISLVINNELVLRALVAKITSGRAGIKLVKIYNPQILKKLHAGAVVQIIRGDDSFFRKPKEDDSLTEKIKSEEDLFDEKTLLDEDLTIEEGKNRIIKQDNIASLMYGMVEGLNNDGATQMYSQFMGQFAYQFSDNIWAEAGYGYSIIHDFPSLGLDTKLSNIILRMKYTFSAPFHSCLQPYVGYQVIEADSPGAGIRDPGDTNTPDTQLQREVDLVENTKSQSLIFGITLLKRLVPGWFLKVDLGSDILSAGMSLEF